MTTGRRLPACSFEPVCAEFDRRYRVALSFERIQALLETLANSQEELKIVQIVGTNGKETTGATRAESQECIATVLHSPALSSRFWS